MTKLPQKSYFICATPRTGSTLLCSMLKSSHVAGYPESYFRKQDEVGWAQQWQLSDAETGNHKFSEFLQASITCGSTDNGVYAARIMWGSMAELIQEIKKAYAFTRELHDINILQHFFGDLQFIHLKRNDYVAQAVSRLRAEQTDLWHISDEVEYKTSPNEPCYDFDRIHNFVKEAQTHNDEWEKWFEKNDIVPMNVSYESLCISTQDTIHDILTFLNISIPKNAHFISSNKRIADSLNEKWIARYHSDIG